MDRKSLARARFARTSSEGGGGQQTPEQIAAAAAAAQAAADAAKNTGPVEAKDEAGVGLGFPAETKVEDMTADQKAMYWRHEAKKQQKKVPANLAELQAAKEELDRIKLQQQTPADQQLAQVRAETEARVREETNKDAAVELLRVSLHTRGKNAAEIDELIRYVDPGKFLNAEKKIDTAAVSAYLDRVVPAGTAGNGTTYGQGRGYDQTPPNRAQVGKTEAERRGYKAPEHRSSLLPKS